MRLLRGFVAVAVVLAVSACGATADLADERPQDEWETVAGYGLRIDVPPDWHGDVSKADEVSAPILRAATFALVEPPTDIGQRAQRTMDEDDVLITVADYGPLPNPHDTRELLAPELPIAIGRSELGNFEGFREPVATRAFVLDDHGLQIWVVFASPQPPDELLSRANAVLATFAFDAP